MSDVRQQGEAFKKGDGRLSDRVLWEAAENGPGRQVHIHDPVSGIQHNQSIRHIFENIISGYGSNIKKPEAEYAPGDDEPGYAGHGRGKVIKGKRVDAEYQENIGDVNQSQADEQRQ